MGCKKKKGKIKLTNVGALVGFLVLIIVGFQVFAQIIPELNTAGNLVNNSNSTYSLPLKGFFQGNGILVMAVVAGVLLAVIGYVGLGKGK